MQFITKASGRRRVPVAVQMYKRQRSLIAPVLDLMPCINASNFKTQGQWRRISAAEIQTFQQLAKHRFVIFSNWL